MKVSPIGLLTALATVVSLAPVQDVSVAQTNRLPPIPFEDRGACPLGHRTARVDQPVGRHSRDRALTERPGGEQDGGHCHGAAAQRGMRGAADNVGGPGRVVNEAPDLLQISPQT